LPIEKRNEYDYVGDFLIGHRLVNVTNGSSTIKINENGLEVL
jgi:hypothetical protein